MQGLGTYGTTGMVKVFWGAMENRWFEPRPWPARPESVPMAVAYAAQTRFAVAMMWYVDWEGDKESVWIRDQRANNGRLTVVARG